MSFLQVLKDSFLRIFTNPFKLLGLGFIVIVAALFGVLTPTAFNIMPDSMETFPIAIVNEDKGAVYDGEAVNFGDDIIDTVEDNDAVKWEIQEPGYFDDGINNTKYFAAFVIPEDFSENAISAQKGKPEKAEIQYLSDIRKSYIFSQFSKSIKTQLIDIVGQSVSKRYVEGPFDNIYEIKDSLVDAADGSQQVTDGAGELKDGAAKLKKGSNEAHSGAAKLEKGSKQIADGAKTLNGAVQSIDVKGIELSDKQKEFIKQSAATSEEVTGAAKELSSGIGQGVSATVKGKIKGAKDDVMSKDQIQQVIQGLVAAGIPKEQAEAMVSGIVTATLNGAADNVTADSITSAVSPSVTDVVTQVAGGSALGGAEKLAVEANKEIMKSAASLNALKAGTKTLADGTEELSSNMGALTAGTAKLADGALKIQSGAGKLQDGSQELTTGLNDGLDRIDDKLVNSSKEMGEFVSEPVVNKDTVFGELTRYSQGFSPLFMALGLWVGSLLLFFVVPLRPKKDELVSSPKTVASGIMMASIFGLMEATLIFIGCNLIGLSPYHPLWLYLFLCFVSIAFITVIYMLCVTFGLAGKLIAVMFTVFQIPCCAGSFPVQLMPEFFQKLNPFLPMTYAIDGIREAFSGNQISGMYHNCAMLCIFLAGSLVISLITCKKTKKRADYIEGRIAE